MGEGIRLKNEGWQGSRGGPYLVSSLWGRSPCGGWVPLGLTRPAIQMPCYMRVFPAWALAPLHQWVLDSRRPGMAPLTLQKGSAKQPVPSATHAVPQPPPPASLLETVVARAVTRSRLIFKLWRKRQSCPWPIPSSQPALPPGKCPSACQGRFHHEVTRPGALLPWRLLPQHPTPVIITCLVIQLNPDLPRGLGGYKGKAQLSMTGPMSWLRDLCPETPRVPQQPSQEGEGAP